MQVVYNHQKVVVGNNEGKILRFFFNCTLIMKFKKGNFLLNSTRTIESVRSSKQIVHLNE